MLLILLALARHWRAAGAMLARHWVLALALLTLAAWAVANRIYLGNYLLASYEVPDFLNRTVLTWFRSSGRFFWPVAWLAVGLGAAFGLAGLRPPRPSRRQDWC